MITCAGSFAQAYDFSAPSSEPAHVIILLCRGSYFVVVQGEMRLNNMITCAGLFARAYDFSAPSNEPARVIILLCRRSYFVVV